MATATLWLQARVRHRGLFKLWKWCPRFLPTVLWRRVGTFAANRMVVQTSVDGGRTWRDQGRVRVVIPIAYTNTEAPEAPASTEEP